MFLLIPKINKLETFLTKLLKIIFEFFVMLLKKYKELFLNFEKYLTSFVYILSRKYRYLILLFYDL